MLLTLDQGLKRHTIDSSYSLKVLICNDTIKAGGGAVWLYWYIDQ